MLKKRLYLFCFQMITTFGNWLEQYVKCPINWMQIEGVGLIRRGGFVLGGHLVKGYILI
jgi:hypothetical protein